MIGQTISHYRIIEKFGGGGMGVVYKAEDTELGRFVALKFLPDDVARDPAGAGTFSARGACGVGAEPSQHLHHLRNWQEDGEPFIAMEFLDGVTLKHRIAGKPLEIEEMLSLGIEIADALDAAHSKGIVHRDIKPANIFVTERATPRFWTSGWRKLTAAAGDRSVQMRKQTLRRPRDRGAPDQPRQHAGHRGVHVARAGPSEGTGCTHDLFSFGAVLYEMATGYCRSVAKPPA